ncbi:hypothetical protein N9V56_00030 [Alphaproteobacteria bacterium]|nr:hypothetical protein [Alphaproteobacteria bacterium]
MKKNILIILVLLVSHGNVIAEEYSMKSIGKNNFKSMIINNEKLTIVENNFTWIDTYANYGTGFCYGSILNNNENITLNNFCEFTDNNEKKFWSKVQRVSSNLQSGLGKQQFLKASDKYKFLLEKDCKYAVSFFHEVNFLLELKCK